jgi:hypothetical protein
MSRAWLVLRNRALTTDNMQKKNWPCNPNCSLCFCQHETTAHLLLHCNFSEALWGVVTQHFNLPAYGALRLFQEPVQWITHLIKHSAWAEKRKRLGILFFVWWHLWKEWNRRVFQGKECSFIQVANLIRDDVGLFMSLSNDGAPWPQVKLDLCLWVQVIMRLGCDDGFLSRYALAVEFSFMGLDIVQ